jgi:hypothetical protein
MPASRIAAGPALQVIGRGEHNVRALVVVILAELQTRWSDGRLGWFILHAGVPKVDQLDDD